MHHTRFNSTNQYYRKNISECRVAYRYELTLVFSLVRVPPRRGVGHEGEGTSRVATRESSSTEAPRYWLVEVTVPSPCMRGGADMLCGVTVCALWVKVPWPGKTPLFMLIHTHEPHETLFCLLHKVSDFITVTRSFSCSTFLFRCLVIQ